MSRLRLNQVAAPSAPASGKNELFYDSTLKRVRSIDEKGAKVDVSAGLDSIKTLVNGSFRFAQRQTPGTLTSYALTTGRSFAADRWGMTIQTSSLQYARVDTNTAPETGLSARFYGQFKQITGAGKFIVSQVMEASQCLNMRGRQVRLQISLKASSAKTIRLGLLQLTASGTVDTIPAAFESAFGADTVDPTFGTNLSKIAPDLVVLAAFGATPGTQSIRNNAIDCSVTTSWQNFGGLFTVPSDCKNLIVVIWTDAQFSVNDILNVSQITLLNQTGDCDWNEWPVATELAISQRYYCKSFPVDTAPVQTGGLAGSVRGNVAVAGAVAAPDAYIRFPVNMRANPTMTYFNPSAGNAFLRNVTAGTDATATANGTVGEDAVDVSATGLAAWTVAQSTAVHYTADAEL
jgi:hypothetical protein